VKQHHRYTGVLPHYGHTLGETSKWSYHSFPRKCL